MIGTEYLFYKNMKHKHGVSFEEVKYNWYYAGTDKNEYFTKKFPGKQKPIKRLFCVCGHRIVENCYITDGSKVEITGNCCIKRFVLTGKNKTCTSCKKVHKNRKNDLCNECRKVGTECCVCHSLHLNKKDFRCTNCRVFGLFKCYTCNSLSKFYKPFKEVIPLNQKNCCSDKCQELAWEMLLGQRELLNCN